MPWPICLQKISPACFNSSSWNAWAISSLILQTYLIFLDYGVLNAFSKSTKGNRYTMGHELLFQLFWVGGCGGDQLCSIGTPGMPWPRLWVSWRQPAWRIGQADLRGAGRIQPAQSQHLLGATRSGLILKRLDPARIQLFRPSKSISLNTTLDL